MSNPLNLFQHGWQFVVESVAGKPVIGSAAPNLLQNLEDRLLYDASPLAGVINPPGESVEILELLDEQISDLMDYSVSADAEYSVFEQSQADSCFVLDSCAMLATNLVDNQVIFVDDSVADYELLIEDILAQSQAGISYEIVILNRTEDGISQISQTLSGDQKYSAVHIIAHGNDGQIGLGNVTLSSSNLATYHAQLTSWSSGLTANADILLYGCEVAQSVVGENFVEQLGELTGADIAASDDLTGHSSLGGDWNLEYVVGDVSSQNVFSVQTQAAWIGSLDILTGLVGHWEFDTDATDVSGSGNDGTLTGNAAIDTNVATNHVGSGKLSLDGADDYVDLSSSAGSLGTLSQGTIAAWINTTETTNTQAIFSNSDFDDPFSFAALGTYQGRLFFDVAENGYIFSVTSDAVVADGNWHHVVFTVDGSGNSLYIDGVQLGIADLTYTFGGSASSTTFLDDVTDVDAVHIGGAGESSMVTYDFDGLIDDARVYNRALTAADVAELYSTGVNDAPVANIGPSAFGVNEDDGYRALPGFSISDVDAGIADLEITLSVSDGVINLTSTTGLTLVSGANNSAAMTFSGNLTDLNAALGTVTYRPDANFNGTDTVMLQVDDLGNTGSGGAQTHSDAANIVVSPANDAPTITNGGMVGLPGADENSVSGSATVAATVDVVSWNDIDTGSVKGLAVVGVSANGSWEYSTDGIMWTPFGAVSAANALLLDATTQIRFVGDGLNGEVATFDFRGWDTTTGIASINGIPSYANPGTGGGTSAFSAEVATANTTITDVNDAPALDTAGAPQLTNVLQNTTDPNGNLVSAIIASAGGDPITDVDNGAVEGIAVTSVDNTNGTWEYSIDGGSNWNAFGAGITDGNAIVLTTTSNDRIRFVPNSGYTGTAMFSYRAWDATDGNTSGTTGIDTTTNGATTAFSTTIENANVYVEPVEVRLWLSTIGNIGPAYSQPSSGVAGVDSWSDGSIIGMGDPNLNFGSGISNGTFLEVGGLNSWAADSDAELFGIHYVTQNFTVTGIGITGGSVDLLVGDFVFVTSDAETLSTTATGPPVGWSNSVVTTVGDIYVFRPENVGDYSSGFFRHIHASAAGITQSVTLVEQATMIGDTLVDAGDFIFSRGGAGVQNDIHWYDTSTATTYVLVEGDDIGIAAATGITGIEIVETGAVLGGLALNTGDVLLTLSAPDPDVGTNNLAVQSHDVVALNFTDTTFGSGSAIATAVTLFDGDGSVNFDHANEQLDGLSLIVTGSGTNIAPTIANSGTPVNFVENGPSVVIDGTIAVIDPDSADFDSGVLNVSISAGLSVGDRISIFNQGSGVGEIGILGNDITYNSGSGAVIIGTFTGGVGTPLTVTLNSDADTVSVQALMRNVTFWNTSDSPATTPRTIDFVLSDGDGGTSNTITQTATVTAVADTPIAMDDTFGLDFDGVDDFVQIADNPSLTMTNTMTMEAWINPDPSTNVNRMIINKEGEYEVALFSDNQIYWAFDNLDPNWAWHGTGYTVTNNVWTHIAVVYDNGTVSTYANGTLVDVYYGSGAIDDAHPTLDELRIGGRSNSPAGKYFDGRIDEVRIWSTALTQAEIQANLGVALVGNEAGLAGYWNFNEGSGLVANDQTSNANHGTLTDEAATGNPLWLGYSTDQNTNLNTPAASGVIANDVDGDGDALTVTAINGSSANVSVFFNLPSGAILFMNPDGSFDYDPNGVFDSLAGGESAVDSFTYQVDDGNGGTDTATVSITIVGIEDSPTDISPDSFNIDENIDTSSGFNFGALTNNDPDASNIFTYSIAGGPDAGKFSLGGVDGNELILTDGILDFETQSTYSVFVQVNDGTTSYNELLTVSVNDINDAPSLTASTSNPTFTENGSSVALFSGTSVNLGDSGDQVDTLTLSVNGLQNGNAEILQVDGTDIALVDGTTVTVANGFNVAISVIGNTATVSITNSPGFSSADAESLIDGLRYENTSENPLGATRNVTLTYIRDDGGTGGGGDDDAVLSILSTVTVTPVNDAPVNSMATINGQAATTSSDGASSVATGDFDGDGDIDIASASIIDNTIQWLENDGSASPSFSVNTINSSAMGARFVSVADVDGDLDLDIIAASTNDHTIAWYENDGSGNFVQQVITSTATGATSAYAADMDGDGDMDIVASSYQDDTIAWYENDGSENFTYNAIDIAANGAWMVYLADVDGDLDMDVVAANWFANEVAWYENDGGVNPLFSKNVISTSINGASSVHAGDVDGDGDIDLLASSFFNDSISLFVNDGSEVFSEQLLTVQADGARQSIMADVDSDGDLDVIGAAANSGEFLWFENDGAASPSFDSYVFSDGNSGPLAVTVDDINNDGTQDVITAIFNADSIVVFENQSGQFANVSTNEDTPLVFNVANGNLISISDVDANNGTMSIALTVDSGTLTLSGTAGLAFTTGDGTDDATMVFTGTLAEVNAALDGMTFNPTPDIFGEVKLTLITGDLGNTGGGALADADTIKINVLSVNDEPIGFDHAVTTNEDTDYVFGVGDFTWADVDGNGLVAVTISSLPTAGTLYLDLNGNGVVDLGETVLATDSISMSDIGLGRLKFQPVADANGTSYSTFTFQVQDDGGTANGGQDTDQSPNTMTIDVLAINDAPVLSNIDDNPTYVEDGSPVIIDADASVLDAELNAINNYSGSSIILLRVSGINAEDQFGFNAGNGITLSGGSLYKNGQVVASFDLTSTPGLLIATFTDANGEIPTQSDVNNILQQLTYVNNSDLPPASVDILWYFIDGNTGAQGLGPSMATSVFNTVNITSINDDPTNSGSLPSDNTVTEDLASNVDLASIDLQDADHNGGNLTVTLTTSSGGNLYAVSSGGVTVGGDGTGVLTLDGTLADLNGYLDVASNVQFLHGTANVNGDNADSITVSVSDNGNTGAGGGTDIVLGTVNIDITSVNDAPSGTDNTVTTLEDTDYVFTAADFGFSDLADGNSLLAVRIDSLPGNGQLLLGVTPVNAGDFISATDIAAGNLIFQPAPDAFGIGYDSFTFQVQDDGGTTNGGIDLDPIADTITIDVTETLDISGTIYEDIVGDGIIGGDPGAGGVTVYLYRDDGSGIPDAADVLVSTAVTDGSGNYDFSVVAGRYWVVVDSTTIVASAGLNGGATVGDLWAEQTYGSAGALVADGAGGTTILFSAGTAFGGRLGDVSDDASSLMTSEHLTFVDLTSSNQANINSGFSFNVVTNLLGGDAQDDDASANRTVQGSLRQFIQNANAISGDNSMRFVPSVATNATDGGGNQWWEINVTNVLPDISDAGTTISGTAYSFSDGFTVLDTNIGQVGSGGTVGVDGLTLDQVDRPELEIDIDGADYGFIVDAERVTIENLSIHGADDTGAFTEAVRRGRAIGITSNVSGSGAALIQGNLIGVQADGTDPGIGNRTDFGLLTEGAATITNNYFAHFNYDGLATSGFPTLNTNPVFVTNNEVSFAGYNHNAADLINVHGFGAVISGNYVHDALLGTSPISQPYNGKGIELWFGATSNLIENNTIDGTVTAGIGMSANSLDNTIRRNIITGASGDGVNPNSGAGILVATFADSTGTFNNTITENLIFNNNGLGIDIDSSGASGGVGDGVTLNDLGDADVGGNDQQNYPVITSVQTDGSTVTISGTLNSDPNSDYRVEFFASSFSDASGHGEAERYLGFATVTTDGGGDVSFTVTLVAPVAADEFVTATATQNVAGNLGSTSEFSQNQLANAAPDIISDGGGAAATVNTAENTTNVTTVTATDGNAADILSYSISGGSDAGLFNINSVTGELSFVSARDFEMPTDANLDGVYQVEVTVSDGNGGLDIQLLDVVITDVNEAPTDISPDTINVNENTDTSGGFSIGTLIATDQDSGETFTYTIAGGVDAARFNISGDQLLLDDGMLDFETQSLYDVTVRVTDSGGLSYDEALVVNVNDVNEAPTAGNDGFTLNEGTNHIGTSLDLLGNDADPEMAPLTVNLISGPANGTLVLNPDGSFTYQHDGSETITDSFQYRVNDGVFSSNIATVFITVVPVNDAPIGVDDSYVTPSGFELRELVGVLANDNDAEGSSINAILMTNAANGTVLLGSDGSFRYIPDDGFFGSDSFAYVPNDGSLSGNMTTVSVEVTAVPQPDIDPIENTDPPADPPVEPPEDPPIDSDPEPSEENNTQEPDPATKLLVNTIPNTVSTTGIGDFSQFESVEEIKEYIELLTDRQQAEAVLRMLVANAHPGIIHDHEDIRRLRLSSRLGVAFDASYLWDQFQGLEDDHGGLAGLHASVGAITTVGALGYIFWSLRGGVLIAAALSQLPSWRMIDPLPVLESYAVKKGEAEQGGVEDFFA